MIGTSQIQAAFDKVTKGWGDAKTVPIIWRNSAANNASDEQVSTVVAFPQHIPAPSISIGIQQEDLNRRGIYQVMLRAPRMSGTSDIYAKADDLVERFNEAMFYAGNYVSIAGKQLYLTSPAEIGADYEDDAGLHVAVTMNYRINNVRG
ncbi:hypothetical protein DIENCEPHELON_9 [Klebsiella phage vB_KaeS_Diencephalon]|nr:hypothetical protein DIENCEPHELON_9 [Klebsiella phage vB_KaeS_Diencephalon]